MFSRRLRLSRHDFTNTTANRLATRVTSVHFSATLSNVADQSGGGAIVISKKVAHTSVGRHLLKRRVRAAMQPWLSPAYALIVYARPGCESLSFSEISVELSDLLPRTGASRTI
ncbi:ribonuclease P protein component [Patescibacteria group bacterium]|nr:ribonuclease P protein component [Patescibacteria group bacterium]